MKYLHWCIGYDLLLPDITNSKGSYLYDSNGKKYVDLESGVWCTPLGHSHPQINQAIQDQLEKISHTGYCYTNPITNEAAKVILQTADLPEGKCVFLASGSESVELGVQILRKLTNKPLLLTLSDSFLGSYGSAGKKNNSEWYFFDWNACKSCTQSHHCNSQCSVISDIPFDQIGGFVFEPGSSSGFVRFPPKALIKNLVKLIKKNNGLLQVNEVTTGIGRTGKWYGFEHYGLKPDIISMGKGLGNGYPVSAIAMSGEIINKLDKIPFIYSQSHQNDPLGCAVAKEVINVIQKEHLIERSEKIGRYLTNKLINISERHSIITEVRSRGLMIAVEINIKNNKLLTSQIFRKLLDKGYIVAYGHNFLRIDPPLIIKKEDINGFLEAFTQILMSL